MGLRFHFTFRSRGDRARPASGCAGRVLAVLFFAFFLAMGLGFGIVLGMDLWNAAAVRNWTPTPCTILLSEVADEGGEDPYVFRIHYRYTVDGRSYDSTAFRRKKVDSGNYETIQRLVDRHPADSRTTCLVNPDNPAEAVLEAESLGYGLFLLLPAVFVLIGAGGIYGTLRPGDGASAPLSSSSSTRELSPRGQVVLFSVFLLVGLAMAVWMGQWVVDYFDARTWQEVPATVVSSRVRSHRSDDGTTYSVDILYRYKIDGRTYHSNRYSFVGGSSSGRDGKRAVVDRYPPGTQTVCYADPDDPSRAVLYRGWSWGLLLALFPLPFIAIGFFGLLNALRRRQRVGQLDALTRAAARPASGTDQPMPILERRVAAARAATDTGHIAPAPPSRPSRSADAPLSADAPRSAEEHGPMVLKPTSSGWLVFIFLLIFTVIWNGVIWTAVSSMLRNGSGGAFDYLAGCFMLPFVLVGLGMVGATIYTGLSLANPRATVTLADRRLVLGGQSRLSWSLAGNSHRITRLKITLEGRESATYRRGTDTTTDHHTFARYTLFESSNPADFPHGECALTIPADTMHSFSAGNNRIVWLIVVHGEIANWPDMKQEFEVQIEPA